MATMMASARSCSFCCSFCTSYKPVLTAKDYFDSLPPASIIRIMHLWNLYWIGNRDGRYSEADWEILAEKAQSIGSCFFRMVLELRTVSAESEEIFVTMITKFHFMLAGRRQELVENGLHLEDPFHPISPQYGEALEVKIAEWREYNMLTEAVISLPSRMMIRRCLSHSNAVLMETFEYAMQSWHKVGEDRIDSLTKTWIWNDHNLKSGQMSDPAALAEEEVMVGLVAPSQLMICAATEEDIVMEEHPSHNFGVSASMAILRETTYGSDVNEGSSVSSSPSTSSKDSGSCSQNFSFASGKPYDRENEQEGSDISRFLPVKEVKNGGKRGRVLRCFRAVFRCLTVCVKGPSTDEWTAVSEGSSLKLSQNSTS
ncbi:hypothetical protein RvY_15519 [Ramazzottius varieornatus]|uniref:Uncharacterized protein n=1 Tax=Ramazzottius varieornatus TaxID=947166 RepID=A0A1D1VV73_RAMVA|nr:hypothetical protein RvY_15519 [Ramazzottius varieornatus]